MFKNIISATGRALQQRAQGPDPRAHRPAARRLFNRHGFEQVSIDHVMIEAGLTRGGFYHHFGSKDELYAEAVASFSSCNPFKPDVSRSPPPAGAARAMLVDVICPTTCSPTSTTIAAVRAAIGRGARGPAAEKAYTQLIRNLTAVYAAALAGGPDGEQRAQAIVSLCVGGMVLARTTDDGACAVRCAARRARRTLALLSGARTAGGRILSKNRAGILSASCAKLDRRCAC